MRSDSSTNYAEPGHLLSEANSRQVAKEEEEENDLQRRRLRTDISFIQTAVIRDRNEHKRFEVHQVRAPAISLSFFGKYSLVSAPTNTTFPAEAAMLSANCSHSAPFTAHTQSSRSPPRYRRSIFLQNTFVRHVTTTRDGKSPRRAQCSARADTEPELSAGAIAMGLKAYEKEDYNEAIGLFKQALTLPGTGIKQYRWDQHSSWMCLRRGNTYAPGHKQTLNTAFLCLM